MDRRSMLGDMGAPNTGTEKGMPSSRTGARSANERVGLLSILTARARSPFFSLSVVHREAG